MNLTADIRSHHLADPDQWCQAILRPKLREAYMGDAAKTGIVPEDAFRRSTSTIADAPLKALSGHAAGMLRTLFHPGALQFLESLRLWKADLMTRRLIERLGRFEAAALTIEAYPGVALWWLVLGALNLACLVFAGRSLLSQSAGRGERWALALVAFYFLLASGGPWGQSRFRTPFMPIVLVLAASEMVKSRRGQPRGDSTAFGRRVARERPTDARVAVPFRLSARRCRRSKPATIGGTLTEAPPVKNLRLAFT